MVRRYYAGAVCVVAVIGILVSLPRVIGAYLDRSDPMAASAAGYRGPDLGSFEAFLMELQHSKLNIAGFPSEWAANYSFDFIQKEHNLRGLYDDARSRRMSAARYRAERELKSYGALLSLSALLAISHAFLMWRSGHMACRDWGEQMA